MCHHLANWNVTRTTFATGQRVRSKIEWTEQTWNPVTGCSNVSPGCKNCYARVFANRLRAMGVPEYANGFQPTVHPRRLVDPISRQRPTIYFVNSMSDLFHEDVPFGYIDNVLEVIEKTPHHQYQILTKRQHRMETYFAQRTAPANAWLGVSIENRKHGLPRIDVLRGVTAAIRFLSIEPLLEPCQTARRARGQSLTRPIASVGGRCRADFQPDTHRVRSASRPRLKNLLMPIRAIAAPPLTR